MTISSSQAISIDLRSPLASQHTSFCLIFFFNDTATTEIYTLSLHDALPIWERPQSGGSHRRAARRRSPRRARVLRDRLPERDRKSTRLNSSHLGISYAVFCLKKKHQLLPYRAG